MPVAQLGFDVDSSQARSAAVNLDALADSADQAGKAEIRLVSSSRAADTATGRLASSVGAASSTLRAGHGAAGKTAAEFEHLAKAGGLNNIQMMEFTHIGKSVFDQILAGQNPVRALAMEFSRLGTAFTYNNTLMGTLRALVPVLLPVVAVLATLAVGFDAFLDKFNEGRSKPLSFGQLFVGVVETMWHEFSDKFGKMPKWAQDVWSAIGSWVEEKINEMIASIAVFAIQINQAMHDIPDYFTIAWNSVQNIVVGVLNAIIDKMREMILVMYQIPGVGTAMAGLATPLAGLKDVSAPGQAGISAAQADIASTDAQASKDVGKALSTNYMDEIYKYGSASGKTKKTTESGYDKALDSAKKETDALKAQADALGKTAEQTAYLEEKTKLLAQAQEKGISLSPKQLQAIDAAAKEYAAEKASLEALTAFYDLGKQSTEDFFSTLKSDLKQGTSLWGSLGDAASKALDDIADKALQMAADGVWNLIFGSLESSSGGSSGMGTLLSKIFHFASGTDSAPGGLSLVGENGPELVDLPAGARVNTASQTAAMLSGSGRTFSITNVVQGSGLTMQQLQDSLAGASEKTIRMINARFPDAVQAVQKYPLDRGKQFFQAA